MMVDARADANAKNELGQTPLTIAADMNSVELMELMLKDADLNQRDKFDNTCLHIAAANLDMDMCKSMLKAVKNQDNFDLNCTNYKGHTAFDVMLQHMVSDPSSWNTELCRIVSEAGLKPLKSGRDAFFKAIEI